MIAADSAPAKAGSAETKSKARHGRPIDLLRDYARRLGASSLVRRELFAVKGAPESERRGLDHSFSVEETALDRVCGEPATELLAVLRLALKHRDPLLGSLIHKFAPELLRLMG